MKHRTGLALAALSAPALLAFAAPGERIAFSVAEGTTISKTFTSASQMSMDDMTQVMNGEEMDLSMLGNMEMSMDMNQTIVVVDTYRAVGDGRPVKLERLYESLGSEMQMDGSMMGPMAGGDAMDADSELEGVSVVFEWNADEDDYDVSFAEGEDGDADLLDDLEADMDLRGLLPAGEVSEGDTWDVPCSVLVDLLAPGGNLKILPEDEMGSMSMPGAGNPYDALGDFDGTFTGEFVGIREVDGVRCAVIALEVDATSTKDMTDMMVEMMEEMEMPEGAPDMEYEAFDMEMEFSGSGELLWNLAGGHVHSLDLSGDSLMAMDMAMSMSMGGQDMAMETSIEMSGSQSLTVSTGASQ